MDESEIIDDENYIDTNGAETIDENFIDVDESEIFKHCCNFCGKSFVNNGTLRHHIKTVSIFFSMLCTYLQVYVMARPHAPTSVLCTLSNNSFICNETRCAKSSAS